MAPKECSFFQLHSVCNNERWEMFFYLESSIQYCTVYLTELLLWVCMGCTNPAWLLYDQIDAILPGNKSVHSKFTLSLLKLDNIKSFKSTKLKIQVNYVHTHCMKHALCLYLHLYNLTQTYKLINKSYF